ncbi:MAG: hypothetical protein HY966_05545 [Ignavibacteriales bacterium]|nr:hypothetical protein [Ignavibacteriales bacterium]
MLVIRAVLGKAGASCDRKARVLRKTLVRFRACAVDKGASAPAGDEPPVDA